MAHPTPRVSVVMPVYNGAAHVATAIRSVLGQTVQDFELVIANDGSTDKSDEVIRGFQDPRLTYIKLERNQGADAARVAAIRQTSAPWVSMLDQDDEFHPRKLEAHLALVRENPAVDITYNSRYDLLCSGRGVWQMFRPPAQVGIADFLLGFPISPSEVIVNREIAESCLEPREGDVTYHGGEIQWFGRLCMQGRQFGFIDQALNYRRHHPGRGYRGIASNCGEYIRAQNMVLDDPRCPESVRALRASAHTGSYVIWGTHALAQGELELGRDLLRKAIELTPSLLEGRPSDLVQRLASFAITDDTRDHEALLRSLFSNLPAEAQPIASELDWAIDHGYLVDGILAVIWGRPDDARDRFAHARKRGAEVDAAFLDMAAYHLSHYESDAGEAAADDAAQRLAGELAWLGAGAAGRRLRGLLRLGRAFRHYEKGNHRDVPANVVSAMAGDPAHSLNRGAWSILMRSLLRRSA